MQSATAAGTARSVCPIHEVEAVDGHFGVARVDVCVHAEIKQEEYHEA